MTRTIQYYYSLNSPWTYLGGVRLEETARRHGAAIDYKPVSLQEVFPVSGGLPLGKRAPQRQAYRLVELARWRDFVGMPLNLKPQYFPAAEWPAAGMVIAAKQGDQDCGRLTNAILKAVWAEERNIADTGTLRTIAGEIGMDGDALLEAAASGPVAAEYAAYTAEAIERGVFGAPTYVFDDQMFWGQDRLDFLDRALAGT
ncbi:MAG: 2-hydroxychromene-2-carboxylate isomerase [Rhodospirillales bacterium]